jgi:5'-methylthioadenosine phosphorylase
MGTEGALGVMGGTGLYDMEGLEVTDQVQVDTPFGEPSDCYAVGELEGRQLVFLPRHGRGHRLLPHELNFRANIYGFKKLGVERIVAVSAVGSMREEVEPLHVVLPDQFIDRTRRRADTFFGRGVVAHISFADPLCPDLRSALGRAARSAGATVWPGGSYVCIEGPAFSTRAESHLYRSWDASVIGMTNLPEAKLAREAEICYATMALVTDFDCWHEGQEEVTAEMILRNLEENAATAQRTLRALMPILSEEPPCQCRNALRTALVTPPDRIPAQARQRLDAIIRKYLQ